MARKTPPSFDFYPDDFIGGTIDMEAIELGMYVRCLCYQWGKALLPNDPKKLQRITGVFGEDFDKYWPAVREKLSESDEGGLMNRRLEVERQKKLALSEARREAGKKGGSSKAKAKLKQRGKQKPSKGKLEVGSRKKEVGSPEDGARKWAQVPIPEHLGTDAFLAAWSEWLEYRHESGKPYKTELGVTRQLSSLAKLGEPRAIAAIEHSIAQEYQGIYEPGSSARTDDDPRGNFAARERFLEEIERE